MDMPKEFEPTLQWEHIVIRPCYVNYRTFRHMPLGRLKNEWDRAKDNYDAMDIELRVQAWQDMMAIVKCFRERYEWDSKKRCPKEQAQEVVGKPMWVTNGLKPMTPEWLEHWKNYPKEQPSMIKHSIREAKKRGVKNES